MRFTENAKEDFPQASNSDNDAFFITEDIRDDKYGDKSDYLDQDKNAIQEEKSDASQENDSKLNKPSEQDE